MDLQIQPRKHRVRLTLDAPIGNRHILECGDRFSFWGGGSGFLLSGKAFWSKDCFSFFHCDRKRNGSGEPSGLLHPMGCNGHLRRKDIAALQFLHPLEGFACRQYPLHHTVLHQHHMFAEVCNIFGVMLDDDDGLAVVLVQFP